MLADPAARGIEHAVARVSEAVTAIDVSRSELGRALRLLKGRTTTLRQPAVSASS
jgi:hypothetical protein